MHQLNLFPQDGIIYKPLRFVYTMKYTVKDLRVDFPNEEACLEWLINYQFPDGVFCIECGKVTKHYKIKGRRVYSCSKCGHHISPTSGTIFNKSSTPLTDWFLAVWLMSSNKAGTSAKQIERELGVTYKTAWRMMHQIRKMMDTSDELLSEEVEIDESYWHANVYKRSSAQRRYGRTGNRSGEIMFGMVQRGGPAKVWHVKSAGVRTLMPLIENNIKYGSLIHSDGYRAYNSLPKRGFDHRTTNHSIWQFYTEDSYTQNIENLWSTMKPRWRGTFKHISPKYLQKYVDEYVWRYSHRKDVNMFWSLMGKIDK
jgi:transposase